MTVPRVPENGIETTSASLRGKRILVVDDEPILVLTFRVLLERAGAIVLTASNGADGLDATLDHSPHVILCDRAMPVMNGIAMLRALRAIGNTTPAMLFLGDPDGVPQDELDRLQVHRVLGKPILPSELIRAMEEICEGMPDTSV